jgi:hypothetical protein
VNRETKTAVRGGLPADALRIRAWLVAALGLGSACGPRILENADGGGGASSTEASDDGASETSDSGSPGGSWACAAPEPIVIGGRETGFVQCAEEGAIYREEEVPGPWRLEPDADACIGVAYGTCSRDDECTAEPGGRCHYGGYNDCRCAYPRECDDPSCEDGVCSALDGLCIAGDCRTSADCGEGWSCGYSVDSERCGDAFSARGSLHCHGAQDTCSADADCGDPNLFCIFEDTSWRCAPKDECTVPGRPFIVRGTHRLPDTGTGAAWRFDVGVRASALGEEVRARLVEHWLEQARMEHASVAAFARHVLQLLGLGAPPSLVCDAQAAMADEVRHAQLAFTLASRFAGRDLDPGPLDCTDALGPISFAELVTLVFEEGCVGETSAALEAVRAAAGAVPELRPHLERLADDETRHAAHAWQVVQWALALGGSKARDALRRAVADLEHRRTTARTHDAPASPLDAILAAHGCLCDRERERTHREVLTTVVLPTARLLLEQVSPSTPALSRS